METRGCYGKLLSLFLHCIETCSADTIKCCHRPTCRGLAWDLMKLRVETLVSNRNKGSC